MHTLKLTNGTFCTNNKYTHTKDLNQKTFEKKTSEKVNQWFQRTKLSTILLNYVNYLSQKKWNLDKFILKLIN